MSTRIGIGVYGVQEAARLAGVNGRTAGRWFSGDGRGIGTRRLDADYKAIDGRYAASFLDLIDLVVVGRLREAGVSFATIWKCYRRLQNDFNVKHAFCHRELSTDGRRIYHYLESDGERHLEDASDGQRAMDRLLKPYLEAIEYDEAVASRWNVAKGVLIDPRLSLGKPVVRGTGVTTFVLANAHRSNGRNYDIVADLYMVSARSVKDAVDFEREFRSGGRVCRAA